MGEKNHELEEIETFTVKKVYDPFLRFLHIWNGLAIFSLMITIWFKESVKANFANGSDVIMLVHVYLGFALTTGILLRIIWGFFGPNHARFKNMWFFKDWIQLLKTRKIDESPNWGHDKYASAVYLIFYLMMIYQALSGLALAARRYGIGPFSSFIIQAKEKSPFLHNLEEVHEFVFYASMVYIVLHIGMIKIHEMKNKHPIAQAMFSGNQYRIPKK